MRRSLVPALIATAALLGGIAHAETPAPPYREAWRAATDGAASGATIADGVAYVTTSDAVLGFDVATGERVASYPRGGALLRPGVGSVDGRALLVFLDAGSASGASPSPTSTSPVEVVAIDVADGSEPWRTGFADGVAGGLTVVGDTAYLVDGSGTLSALSLRDGSTIWAVRGVGKSDAAPVVADGVVYASGAPNGSSAIVAVDAASGERRWTVGPEYGVAATSALAVQGDTLAYASSDRIAHALDVADGSARWNRLLLNVPSPVTSPAIGEDLVIGIDYAGGVYRLDRSTGADVWDHQLNALTVRSGPVLAGDAVVLGTNDGRVVALDASNGHLIADVRLGDGVVGTLAADGDLLLAPVGGPGAALVALARDPGGALLDVVSPTVADPVAIVSRFAVAALVLLGAAAVGGRLAPRRRPRGEAA